MKILSRKKRLILWNISILTSVLLNLMFFDFMSYTVRNSVPKKEFYDYIDMVNVIRIKRKETLLKKEKNEEPQKEKKIKLIKEKVLYTSIKPKIKLNIPFEINPKLSHLPIEVKIPNSYISNLNLPKLKGVYNLSELDRPLIPLVKIPPIYPLRAKRMGIQGWVKVRFVVDEKGEVKDIKIIESKPKGVFESATINAVSKWKFSPGTVDGIPVKTLVEITIKFKLE